MKSNIEYRKVGFISGTTYTITIPRPFVEKLGIKKGQYLKITLLDSKTAAGNSMVVEKV